MGNLLTLFVLGAYMQRAYMQTRRSARELDSARARCKPRNLLGVCIGEELAYIRPKGVAEVCEGRNLPDRVCPSVASDNKEKIKQSSRKV